jgi:hypothetical protein
MMERITNITTSIQTAISADAHPEEGIIFLENRT